MAFIPITTDMARYCTTYLGPYIVCDELYETDYKNYLACPKEGCSKKAQKGNFCNTCGTKLENKKEPIQKRIYLSNLMIDAGLEEDMFYSAESNIKKGKILFAYNRQSVWSADKDDTREPLDLTNFDVQEKINRFKEKRSDYIKIIQDNYSNVEVCYGLYSDYR